jgi:hypothetical protein
MVDPIEAVADAIMCYEGWKPWSPSYQNRNPGNLKHAPSSAGIGIDGFAYFRGLEAGYSALCGDLAAKFSGNNHYGLGPESTLYDLFCVYAPAGDHNAPLAYAQFVSAWLTRALKRGIHYDTTLRAIAPYACPAPPASPKPGA